LPVTPVVESIRKPAENKIVEPLTEEDILK